MTWKEGLRYAETIAMALYVMTAGTWQMPVWSADNLDLMVRCYNLEVITAILNHSLIASNVVAFERAYFGEGSGDIFLDELACTGNELQLTDCAVDQSHDCTHAEDAGVRCEG